MSYLADLHIHSKYAGACSHELTIPNLAQWAIWKGIDLVGTGDALHPMWQQELKQFLLESDGVYKHDETKFVVSGEISCIYSDERGASSAYSEGGKTRRIHLILIYPSLETAIKLAEKLTKKGAKLASDGRPILGMSSKQICELAFSVDPNILIIPAHIWTPWFSLYGSNSGYDKLSDCFGEFSDQIFAVETGLSSEPAMNWRIGELDTKSIVSFSDLHSLPRLGREVTVIDGHPSFFELRNALRDQKVVETIEFFPEEGKYHYSGHRKCGIVYGPEELKHTGEICPVCGRRLTIGVIQRVEELATRSNEELKVKNNSGLITSETFPDRGGFRMLVQLEEIIAESVGVSVKTIKVQTVYKKLVTELDNELNILTKVPLEAIAKVVGEKIAEGVKRVRAGQLTITPGFDNTYGKVKIFAENKKVNSQIQQGLFS